MATRSRSTRQSNTDAQVTLRGRFPAGTRVSLVKVAGEHVLRSQGGKVIDTATVDDDGTVQFTSGVEKGARYFITGYIRGVFTEVRARGNAADQDNAVLAQPPVQPDETTTGIGRQPVPEDSEPYGLRLAQEQVGDDVQQRSATPTGTAHPVDPDERGPYPSQQDEPYKDGDVEQRSDTELGMATPIPDVPQRQEDVPDTVQQRSSTPTGVATPLPPGDAVQAVQGIESAEAKAMAGEPVQAEIRGVVPGESIPSDGEPHRDNEEADYVPALPGQDPEEGYPDTEPEPTDATGQPAVTPDDTDTDTTPASPPATELRGEALKARARELDIKGRGSMSVRQLRAAITRAEKKS